ncbi:hypothetical protein IQ07DRAFT_289146 [Pyrenochaeta sp. DS3sAY3a]|nr:hypothetical protein IQ07DRAFT_289146 [Pyrenochaeta sp. DS3sAY3a]
MNHIIYWTRASRFGSEASNAYYVKCGCRPCHGARIYAMSRVVVKGLSPQLLIGTLSREKVGIRSSPAGVNIDTPLARQRSTASACHILVQVSTSGPTCITHLLQFFLLAQFFFPDSILSVLEGLEEPFCKAHVATFGVESLFPAQDHGFNTALAVTRFKVSNMEAHKASLTNRNSVEADGRRLGRKSVVAPLGHPMLRQENPIAMRGGDRIERTIIGPFPLALPVSEGMESG